MVAATDLTAADDFGADHGVDGYNRTDVAGEVHARDADRIGTTPPNESAFLLLSAAVTECRESALVPLSQNRVERVDVRGPQLRQLPLTGLHGGERAQPS